MRGMVSYISILHRAFVIYRDLRIVMERKGLWMGVWIPEVSKSQNQKFQHPRSVHSCHRHFM